MGPKGGLELNVKNVSFTINDQPYTVHSGEVSADLNLATFIRERIGLTGTKVMCAQAGCGACVVSADVPDPSGNLVVKSVNSCITPILSCNGWHITTVEGLGNKRQGLHPIQKRLAAYHGTQCGYCSPGMVMQMNSLMERNPDATMEEVEAVLDGNLCRCTGYRPIFDAFKSMASDAPHDLVTKMGDIEDMPKFCPRTKKPCAGKCHGSQELTKPIESVCMQFIEEGNWFMPVFLTDLLNVLNDLPEGTKYRLVAGNTGTGVFNEDGPYTAYIDVKKISDLTNVTTAPTFEVGGGTNLHDFILLLEDLAAHDKDYFYGKDIGAHLRKVANTAVRHMGTIAGNLMLKHAHNDFPSDVFVLLEAVGAQIVTVSVKNPNGINVLKPSVWLKESMDKAVIVKIVFPKLNPDKHIFKSFKITPRSQNAHAYVNAAFLLNVNKGDYFKVVEKPSLVYGGISEHFVHATKTEEFLVGKSLQKLETLRGAMALLEEEVKPVEHPVGSSAHYRKHLTQALLYKVFIAALEGVIDPALLSGATQIPRNLSKGDQSYRTDESLWPVNKGIPKIEGQSQCSGEAEYVSDIAPFKGEVHAAFVISTQARCDLDTVDPSDALKMPGVLAYIDHKDIPGKNNWAFFGDEEEIFSTGHIYHAGQTIGMIIAETSVVARKAAKAVKITYKNIKQPIFTIREAFEKEPERVSSEMIEFFGQKPAPAIIGDVEAVGKEDGLEVIEGEIEIGSQYHFYMETLACIVRPIEDDQYEVYCTTQWMHLAQAFIASALNIQKNKVDVKVRRLGGGYGGKATPAQLMAAATALAAFKVNRPVRVVLDLKSNMEMFGKKFPYLGKYKVGATKDGLLKFVDLSLHCNTGYSVSQATVGHAIEYSQNAYNSVAWSIKPLVVTTDTPPNTFCRAPGTTQGHAIIEYVMDHLATRLGIDPLELRMKNFLKEGDALVSGKTFDQQNPLPMMIEKIKQSSNFDERQRNVDAFNKSNVWRKRGIAIVPCKYGINYFPLPVYCHISVYEGDGTISVATGGIEMGQGLNTKVAAIVARELGVPLEMVSIKPSDSFVEPNNSVTGGSMTSELCVNAAKIACQKLKDRMATIRSNMEGAKWHQLVTACFYQGVDLCVRHMGHNLIDQIKDYFLWGCVVTEVELDLLTGEKKVVRVDILEDTGASLNPEVDIGQIEGAFMFGLGFWLQEEIKFHPQTGQILTNDTWEYKPPASFDIPETLNVTLYEWDKDSGRGVLGSKATGEPAVHMGVSCILALRRAINAGRRTLLNKDEKDWYPLSGPATVEKTQLTSGITSEHFVL